MDRHTRVTDEKKSPFFGLKVVHSAGDAIAHPRIQIIASWRPLSGSVHPHIADDGLYGRENQLTKS